MKYAIVDTREFLKYEHPWDVLLRDKLIKTGDRVKTTLGNGLTGFIGTIQEGRGAYLLHNDASWEGGLDADGSLHAKYGMKYSIFLPHNHRSLTKVYQDEHTGTVLGTTPSPQA